ncbi:inactive protein RESTRICTED TEV MOVEMENT 2 [Panicum miliaceum]|uniref:Inactive protein RESTRICTED TEV MOVEMENT 2 n=1 Tax=Panicum miliaceum TaxID=4540 RepID=A0A3L6S6K8_PANMI|nr:inactive protein RESTRICTED TEV MOVEMENT 2 [Panicum miliaceum]
MNPKPVELGNLRSNKKQLGGSSPLRRRGQGNFLLAEHGGLRWAPAAARRRGGGVAQRPSIRAAAAARGFPFDAVRASAINGLQRSKSNLESLFCYDKSVPEEDVGKPTGLNVEKKNVGDNPPCTSCEAKGAVLCATCAGSGLYVDSILESQGIIVKVRCLARIAIAINTYHQQEKHSDRKHLTFSQFEGSIVEEAASMDRASNRAYEEFDPSVAWSRGAEADSVKIREDIRVLVDNHGHLRTRGERLVAGTRWSRFQKDFQLPDNCSVDGIRAKFESETLTITLPKKTPSPPSAPVTPVPPMGRAAAPSQKIPPPALPEPAAPPAVPAAPLAPATSQRQPAERRPSLPRKPSAVEPAPELPARLPSVPTPAAAATKPEPSLAAVHRAKEDEEEEKRMEREMMGKMEEDRKAAQEKEKKETAQERQDEAAMGEMAMAHQPRPAPASRRLLVNVAVAAALLLGITVYVWHNLRNAAGGAGGHTHGHGHLGAGSYGDEM